MWQSWAPWLWGCWSKLIWQLALAQLPQWGRWHKWHRHSKLCGHHKGVDPCKSACLILGPWRRSLLDSDMSMSKTQTCLVDRRGEWSIGEVHNLGNMVVHNSVLNHDILGVIYWPRTRRVLASQYCSYHGRGNFGIMDMQNGPLGVWSTFLRAWWGN